ncbi:unnamed protein product [Kuraishia capsulata CBS 1993]|uniref:Uncharacterized protein n=1 Tax=Kuraishia capsulata CBS 1993 TaxID=1382522 RepID=W6MFZ1_9ASCO|nr:uncharacterized protein KUCA_T00000851001 [Kuraishia capsulata CBS 1993]CDK24884.1 unnamed protein product [Kuraishia capsulata CBS 1993]
MTVANGRQISSKTRGQYVVYEEEGVKYAKVLKNDYDMPVKVTKEDLTVSEPATAEKIIEKIEIYGGCIVKNYLPEEVVDAIYADAKPYLDQDFSWDGSFFPAETRRVSGMCVKSKTCAEKFLSHELNIAVSEAFLGRENASWVGDQIVEGYSPPQHNSTITFRIGPGAKDQVLHRDDIIHHNIHRHNDTYRYGDDSALGTALGLTRTTKANGATRFIPGSHLWDHWRQPKDEEVVYAELEKGDCFFMLASCYHGGSANTTEDEFRAVTILFMTLGTLRQEENIMLGTPVEYFKALPVKTLKLLGLTTSDPFLGYIDFKDPLALLKPEEHAKENKDFYTGTYKGVTAESLAA